MNLSRFRRPLPFAASLFAMLLSLSCQIVFPLSQFGDVCRFFDEAQIKEQTDQGRELVFESPGTIAIFHGFGTADSRRNGTEDIIKVTESLILPSYATSATVFLNGWRTKYLSKDHHVSGVGTFIRKVVVERGTLRWEAFGVMGDKNFDDAYEWTYHYTVIAWNPSALDLVIDDHDAECAEKDSANIANATFFMSDNSGNTALSAFPSFLRHPGFALGNAVAILPRGFGILFRGADHHLLQLAVHGDHSEPLVEGGAFYHKLLDRLVPVPEPPSPEAIPAVLNTGFASWETYTILKDNSTRDYVFGQIVSGLGGRDVGLIQPPFAILPADDEGFFGATLGPVPGVHNREYVIENVPFEVAFPVLGSWDLGYGDDDEHVTEVGIWIDTMSYERPPGAPVGTLRYTLTGTLQDKNGKPGHLTRHAVTIVGLRRLGPAVVEGPSGADLVPFSPAGVDPKAFCRLEEERKLLRVSVKNAGGVDAGPSRTTVSFGSSPFTMNTPAVASGASVDLLFKVPNDCIQAGCAFRITVDSAGQVDEGDQEGNNSVSGTCEGP